MWESSWFALCLSFLAGHTEDRVIQKDPHWQIKTNGDSLVTSLFLVNAINEYTHSIIPTEVYSI